MTAPVHIETLAVIGVGLIGGSFALGLKKAGVVGRVLGVGRRPESLQRAQSLGLIDEIVTARYAAQKADLIMVAAPVCAFEEIFRELADHLSDDVILTDGGSTKGSVVHAARTALGERIGQFVPAHPMAGSHLFGPEAAYADLYRNRNVILCPIPENSARTIEYVQSAWQACGARISRLDVSQHDEVVAAISHLPHWLASLYVLQVARDPNSAVDFQMAGAGFADFSRIAQGSEEMWRDIFIANRTAMLSQIERLHQLLDQAKEALQNNDFEWIENMLRESAERRRAWEHERS